jgi:hypothetical protein
VKGQPGNVGRTHTNLGRELRQLLPPLRRQPDFKSLTHAAMLRQPSVTATHSPEGSAGRKSAAPNNFDGPIFLSPDKSRPWIERRASSRWKRSNFGPRPRPGQDRGWSDQVEGAAPGRPGRPSLLDAPSPPGCPAPGQRRPLVRPRCRLVPRGADTPTVHPCRNRAAISGVLSRTLDYVSV